jgi:hypothetical protein
MPLALVESAMLLYLAGCRSVRVLCLLLRRTEPLPRREGSFGSIDGDPAPHRLRVSLRNLSIEHALRWTAF